MTTASDRLFQRAVYDGLWNLLRDVLAEQQRRIDFAWELPDKYDHNSPDRHERTQTIEAIIAVFSEAQRDIIRACGQGWYSESETRMCYWPWVRHIEFERNYANHATFQNESDVQQAIRRRYCFMRAHLWVWLVRRMTPVYQASQQWRYENTDADSQPE